MPETPLRPTTGASKPEMTERKFLLASSHAQQQLIAPPSPRLLFSRTILSSPILCRTPPPPQPTTTNKRVKEDLFSSPNSRSVSPCSLDENTELKEIFHSAHDNDDDDEEQDLPLKSIPNFDYERLLGAGHFGQVDLIICKENMRKYALKAIKQPMTQQAREAYISSLQRWDKLRTHRNIIPFLRAWQDNAILYILMGYCAGGTLGAYCEHHVVSEQHLLVCFRDMLSALEFMHDKRQVHMDCKPANICVNSRGVCMLGDMDQVEIEGTPCPHKTDYTYAPREMQECNYRVAGSGDVFAMAISFLELALRSPLPQNDKGWIALRDSTETTPQFLQVQQTHPTLAGLILPAMHRDPASRPSAKELLARFPPASAEVPRLHVSIEDMPPPNNNRPESANLITPSLPAATPALDLLMCEETLSDKFNSVLVSPKGTLPVIGFSPRSSRMTSPVSFQASPPARTTTVTTAVASSPFASSPVAFMFRSAKN